MNEPLLDSHATQGLLKEIQRASILSRGNKIIPICNSIRITSKDDDQTQLISTDDGRIWYCKTIATRISSAETDMAVPYEILVNTLDGLRNSSIQIENDDFRIVISYSEPPRADGSFRIACETVTDFPRMPKREGIKTEQSILFSDFFNAIDRVRYAASPEGTQQEQTANVCIDMANLSSGATNRHMASFHNLEAFSTAKQFFYISLKLCNFIVSLTDKTFDKGTMLNLEFTDKHCFLSYQDIENQPVQIIFRIEDYSNPVKSIKIDQSIYTASITINRSELISALKSTATFSKKSSLNYSVVWLTLNENQILLESVDFDNSVAIPDDGSIIRLPADVVKGDMVDICLNIGLLINILKEFTSLDIRIYLRDDKSPILVVDHGNHFDSITAILMPINKPDRPEPTAQPKAGKKK
jgi:DNA polymerase III sliding clamp (beta) subunit (PCNA family)